MKTYVFIRFDAHVVKAGINLRACGPLTSPGLFGTFNLIPQPGFAKISAKSSVDCILTGFENQAAFFAAFFFRGAGIGVMGSSTSITLLVSFSSPISSM